MSHHSTRKTAFSEVAPESCRDDPPIAISMDGSGTVKHARNPSSNTRGVINRV